MISVNFVDRFAFFVISYIIIFKEVVSFSEKLRMRWEVGWEELN